MFSLFEIDKNAEDARAQLDKAVDDYTYANETKDFAHSAIMKIITADLKSARAENQRIKERKNQAMAQKANQIAAAVSA